MSSTESNCEPSDQVTSPLIDLIEEAAIAGSFEELAGHLLPTIVDMAHLRSAFLYIEDPRLLASHFFEHGLQPESSCEVEKLCTKQLGKLSSQAKLTLPAIPGSTGGEKTAEIILYPIINAGTSIGLIGLVPEEQATFTLLNYWEQILRVIASTIGRLARSKETERQLAYLNTYKTVSSMLGQELGIHDLLDSAEAASILILDDEKKSFKFYQAEGPVKLTLIAETFPADKGIAGSILNAESSEVINDVQSDPHFYGMIDTDSGFHTRNMIAVPLIAGEERIGVLEVLNKANGGSFTEEERLLLSSIAEEIAFAIRNAKVFDYVVNSYCKQRQGQGSCKGCKRPLGSWTPCIKYRNYEV